MNRVYGQTVKRVDINSEFTLTAYTNYTGGTIAWYKDSELADLISLGDTVTLNTLYYNDGDNIYANINGVSGVESLIVALEIVEIYPTLPKRFVTNSPVDIDSIYFKFHKCLSGVCYNYCRDIEGIYEENNLTGDGEGSYNMYNEFDIIDEFFSNSHEVDVAYGSNVILTEKINALDGVKMYIGTRVLLYAQTSISEIGIYEVKKGYTLEKTDELVTQDDIFRFKVHIGAGSHLDDEFHVNGFTNV